MADRSSPYGFDMYVGPVGGGVVDMTSDGRSCSGAELVRNALVARSMTNEISMIGAPGDVVPFGKDVREWVGQATAEGDDEARAQELAIVYARDPRVDAGSISVVIAATLAGSQYEFTIAVDARLTNGLPISMVIGVSSLTVELLASQGSS